MDGRKMTAALLVCLCFGSIHAYGVLLVPVEQWLGISRMLASLGYALAVAALTLGVYLNGRLATSFTARTRLLGCGAVAALGLLIAGGTASTAGLLAGFGLMYGLANGAAYASALVLAASAMPGREAQAMGIATASYGLGAVLFAQFFGAALGSMNIAHVLQVLAPVNLAACVIGSLLAASEPQAYDRAAAEPRQTGAGPLLSLWFSYLLGSFSGLMVIAHAPAISAWREVSSAEAGLVSGAVSFGSIAGGYLGGLTGAWLPGPRGIAIPMLVQAAVLAGLPFVKGLSAIAAVLGVAGLCYGVLIAVIPAEVRRIAGPHGFAANYGKVFSAWGIAGVAGPVTAGYLYDLTLGYGAALTAAAALSLASSLFILGVGK